MERKINSAYRIHKLLSGLFFKDNKQVLEAWGETFRISHPNHATKALVVSECLNAIRLESLILQEQTAGLVRQEIIESHVGKIHEAISPMLLPSTWSAVKQYLTADTLLMLDLCSDMLPNEETQVSQEDLDNILIQVEELEASLVASTLPYRLKSIIQHHIKRIKIAIAVYPVSGVKALKSALHEALGDVVSVGDELDVELSGANAETVKKFKSVWQKVSSTVQSAETVITLIGYGSKGWDKISGFLNLLP